MPNPNSNPNPDPNLKPTNPRTTLKKGIKKLGSGLETAGLAILCCPLLVLLFCGCIHVHPCGNARQAERREKRYAKHMAVRSKNEPIPLSTSSSKNLGTRSRNERKIRRRVSISEERPILTSRQQSNISSSIWNLLSSGKGRTRKEIDEGGDDNNASCFMMKLPVEVRRKIWIEVIGNDVLHILQLRKRLGHKRCIFPAYQYQREQEHQHQHQHHQDPSSPSSTSITEKEKEKEKEEEIITLPPFHDSTRLHCFGLPLLKTPKPHQKMPLILADSKKYRYGDALDTDQNSDNSLPLLLTCREIYKEAQPLLYQTNTFDINHPTSLIYLSKTIPASHICKIRNLQVRYAAPFGFEEGSRVRGWDAFGFEGRGGRRSGSVDSVEVWEAMCDVISREMKGLKVLRLVLTGFPDGEHWGVGVGEREDVVSRCLEGIVGKRKVLGVGDKEDGLECGSEGGIRGLDDFRLRLLGFGGMDEGEEIDISGLEGKLRVIVCSGKQ